MQRQLINQSDPFILSSPKFPVLLTLVQINNKCLIRQQKQMASCCYLQRSLVPSMERRRKTQQAVIFKPQVVTRWPMLRGVTTVSVVARSFAAPDEELRCLSLTGNMNLKVTFIDIYLIFHHNLTFSECKESVFLYSELIPLSKKHKLALKNI